MKKVSPFILMLCMLLLVGCIDEILSNKGPKYTIAKLNIDPPEGNYHSTQTVSITCETKGVSIYYTTDGSVPKKSSNYYSAPIKISHPLTLKARAFKENYKDSEIATVVYKYSAAEPQFNPPNGTYHNNLKINITSETEGAVIYYTTDGSEPTKSSTVYSKPVEISQPATLKAKAFKQDWDESKTVSSSYKFVTANPLFDPPGGGHFIGEITISCPTEGAVIYYTTDGSEPSKSSILYSKPLNISGSTTLKARAFKDGWGNSEVSSAYYNVFGIYIEGGSFQMGCDEGHDNGRPAHTVTLNDFYLGKYEVTQAEWLEVMDCNPSNWKSNNLPVENVTWFNAIEYCNKRSILEGLTPCYSIEGDASPEDWESGKIRCNWNADGYRLPTEAEWEYAARGGKKNKGYNFSGSNYINEIACYIENSGGRTRPVGERKANELGLYDMSGNVNEWCWDWYSSSYYSSSPQDNPKGIDNGYYRVRRGGGYNQDAEYCHVAHRNYNYPMYSYNDLGFRVCRSSR